jgi:hypothetical protein
MKGLKALGLAAVAALALTAFLGASSASATVLCTTTTSPCGTGWHIDQIILSSTGSVSAHSTSGSLEATCKEMALTGNKVSTGSSTTTPIYSVATAKMLFGGCSQASETLGGGEIEIHQIAGTHNGTVTAFGFKVTTAIAGISCYFTFGTGAHFGVLTGGSPAILHMNAVADKTPPSSFLCPADTVWEGTFQLTNHTAAYVVAE